MRFHLEPVVPGRRAIGRRGKDGIAIAIAIAIKGSMPAAKIAGGKKIYSLGNLGTIKPESPN